MPKPCLFLSLSEWMIFALHNIHSREGMLSLDYFSQKFNKFGKSI